MKELAYALITPYSLFKSRTGGIISRLFASSRLEFAGTRMFAFSDEFVDEYKKLIPSDGMEQTVKEAWFAYLDHTLRKTNYYRMLPRCMLLLFTGENAVRHIKDDVIGTFTDTPVGNTLRGTFGDLIRKDDGSVHHMEPGVMTGVTQDMNTEHLKLFAKYETTDGGVLDGVIDYDEGEPEKALVILKPDNFYTPSRKPGNIIDTFSHTGLKIVGTKLISLTVAQAEEFYGQLKIIFKDKLKQKVSDAVYSRLKDAFGFSFTHSDADHVAEQLADRNALYEFNRIVEYMTGVNPEDVSEEDKATTTSKARSLALLYEGVDAINKIRTVLGETNPEQAAPGTVRSDFGRDLMRNGAHASDSTENVERELKIIRMREEPDEKPDIVKLIEKYT